MRSDARRWLARELPPGMVTWRRHQTHELGLLGIGPIAAGMFLWLERGTWWGLAIALVGLAIMLVLSSRGRRAGARVDLVLAAVLERPDELAEIAHQPRPGGAEVELALRLVDGTSAGCVLEAERAALALEWLGAHCPRATAHPGPLMTVPTARVVD